MTKQAFPHVFDVNETPVDLMLERYSPVDRQALINDLVLGKTIEIPTGIKEGKITGYLPVNRDSFSNVENQMDYFEKIMDQIKSNQGSNELLYDRAKQKTFENYSF